MICYPAQPGLICPPIRLSVCMSVCTCLQIRYSAENDTGPTELVNYSLNSWIHVNRESEILRKKYISESNTVTNMKLMILGKIGVIHTCSSSPHAASDFCADFTHFVFFIEIHFPLIEFPVQSHLVNYQLSPWDPIQQTNNYLCDIQQCCFNTLDTLEF